MLCMIGTFAQEWGVPLYSDTRLFESDQLSRDLKKRGFNFAGTTICYAFMQAVGMVNDHVVDCYRYNEVKKMAQKVQSTPGRRGA